MATKAPVEFIRPLRIENEALADRYCKPQRGETMMRYRIVLSSVVLMVVAAITGAGQDPTGKITQGLVGGEEVDEKIQEAYGLLKFQMGGGVCTASLLRNDWAISAAHCVDQKDTKGQTMPDPARPGQNIMRPLGPMRLTAAWGGGQTKMVTRIETFWPYDVALIRLDSPMQVNGSTSAYAREVLFDQFPYFGSPGGADLIIFGAGINQFATGAGASAKASSSDDKFRVGVARVARDEGKLYWYPPGDSMIAGGDSGGPSFATVGTNRRKVLVGVHALTHSLRVPGKEEEKGWTWVRSTSEAADAPIKPVWPQIKKIMGPLSQTSPSSQSSAQTEPFTGRHSAVFENTVPFNTAVTPGDFNILYGVQRDGNLVWHRHIIANVPPPTPGARSIGRRRSPHSWNPTQVVGRGWAGNKDVLPAGRQAIYIVKDNGDLMRYWHSGAFDGSFTWGDGPQLVGTGWAGPLIVPSDNGVVYTITDDGNLNWYRNPHYADSHGSPNLWALPMKVGRGWASQDKVFSGGNGVLYVVNNEGKLMWYRHKAYLNPVPMPDASSTTAQKLAWQNSWEGPKEVGIGWSGLTKLFSPGNGHIYAVLPNGDLKWYRHLGWQNGTFNWEGGEKIASGWDAYVIAFARTTGSDPGKDAGVY